MGQLEKILQAWWHSETLSPGELPKINTSLSSEYTNEKTKKFHKINGEINLPSTWLKIQLKKVEMKRKVGVYGNCYTEHDLIEFQRNVHQVEDEIHNKSMKMCYSFYVEFDENNQYIDESLFIPHVNLYVKLASENNLLYDESFFEAYEFGKQYLNGQAMSISGGKLSEDWLAQFINEFEQNFATPPSNVKEHFLELLIVSNEIEQAAKFNSFYTEDILRAKNDMNDTVRQYLLESSNKTDINENRPFIEKSLHPLNLPMGRWPSPIKHRLSLMQQVAVNEFLSSAGSISSVNGPPGTGKTTLLKDIFAEIVVKKAQAITAFRDNPAAALVNTNYDVEIKNIYTNELVKRYVYDIHPTISQYAAVVASSNNTAVENISKDLPKATEIDAQFKNELEHLKFAKGISKKITGSDAWGIFSIPLGKGENIKNAASLLAGENFSIINSLINDKRGSKNKKKSWESACDEFKASYEEVEKLRQYLADVVNCKKMNIIDEEEDFINSTDSFWENKPGQYEYRQQKVLYQTNILNEKRSILFLKALAVLRYFLLMNVERLRAALSLLENRKEVNLNNESGIQAIKAMWNTVHCICPVISTTFASFSSMYKGMPKDFIPYLFIDEAGQATPLQAVGALWRSKKALVVGDPLQIEPVQTLQSSVLEDIRKIYQIDEELLNMKCSVQSVADRANPLGTYVSQNKWIGIPLWVHRRCIEPMFSISNTLAYNGKMVLAKNEIGEGEWLDCQGGVKVNQYVPGQKDELIKHLRGHMAKVLRGQLLNSIKSKLPEEETIEQLLQVITDNEIFDDNWSVDKKQSVKLMKKYCQLRNKLTDTQLLKEIEQFGNGEFSCPNIYVITPFSSVKTELKKDLNADLFKKICNWLIKEPIIVDGIDEEAIKLENTYRDEAKQFKCWYNSWIEANIGTVHTFQGKEATIVYFVTGTDKSKLTSAEWACKEPNLLNVAVTRAKEQFYIIGDKHLLKQFGNYQIIINIMANFKHQKERKLNNNVSIT